MASKEIQLKVIADAKGFQKEIMKIPGMTEKSAASAALRMSKEMHKGFQKVGKDAEKSGKQIGGALSVAVGTALAEIGLRMAQAFDPRQLTELIKAAADTQNQLSDLSAETGLTVQQLALIRLGASSAGKELSTLEGAFRPLAKKIGDFTMGTGEAKIGLERLGFTAQDFVGPSGSMIATSDAFDMISKRLMAVESETDKADAAMRIFGEGAGHLINVLNVAGDETSALARFQETLGLNTDAARQSAAEYQQMVALLNETFLIFGQTLLVNTAPMFEEIAVLAVQTIEPFQLLIDTLRAMERVETNVKVAAVAASIGNLEAVAELAHDSVMTIGDSLVAIGTSGETTAERVAAVRDVFSAMRDAMDKAGSAAGNLGNGLGTSGAALDKNTEDAKKNADALKENERRRLALVKASQELQDISTKAAFAVEPPTEAMKLTMEYIEQANKLHEIASAHEGNAEIQARVLAVSGQIEQSYEARKKALADEEQNAQDLADQEATAKQLAGSLDAASQAATLFSDAAGLSFDIASEKVDRHQNTLASLREEYQSLNEQLQAVNDKEMERLEFHSERTDLTDEMRKKIKDLANDERAAVEAQMELNKEQRRQERKGLREQANLARKMFRMQKAAAVGQALISSGEAGMAVATQFPPPNPLFAVGLGLVAGQLSLSLAQIKAQKAPSFHSGGMIQADERMIRARRGEAVLNERATQRLGESTITGLNEGRMMAPITVNVQVGRRQLERVVIDAMNRQAVEAVGTINPYAAR